MHLMAQQLFSSVTSAASSRRNPPMAAPLSPDRPRPGPAYRRRPADGPHEMSSLGRSGSDRRLFFCLEQIIDHSMKVCRQFACHSSLACPGARRRIPSACFHDEILHRASPSAVRAPVLPPPCILQRPFGMAASRQLRPVPLHVTPDRTATSAISKANPCRLVRGTDEYMQGQAPHSQECWCLRVALLKSAEPCFAGTARPTLGCVSGAPWVCWR